MQVSRNIVSRTEIYHYIHDDTENKVLAGKTWNVVTSIMQQNDIIMVVSRHVKLLASLLVFVSKPINSSTLKLQVQ